MDTIVTTGPKPRKRRPILRIVVIVLAVAAIAEPVIMYRHLERQKAERRAKAERALPAPFDLEDYR